MCEWELNAYFSLSDVRDSMNNIIMDFYPVECFRFLLLYASIGFALLSLRDPPLQFARERVRYYKIFQICIYK